MDIIQAASLFLYDKLMPLYYILVVIGSITIASHLYRLFSGTIKLIFRRKLNLTKRYGQNSWALVTGSSEGIGKQFALELAQQGFNIIILARTESKLQLVRQQIQSINPSIKVKIIVADLSKQGRKQNIDEILPQLNQYDISLIVNNAGVDVLDQYTNLPITNIINLINLNCFSLTALNYRFVKILQDRYKKTGMRNGMINVGSIAGQIPMPYHNIYSASKKYVNHFTENLALQYPQIDWLNVKPGQVSTAMTCFKKIDPLTITTKQCVEGSLRDLGQSISTNGSINHKIQNYLFAEVLNIQIFNLGWSRLFAPQFMKQREEFNKKNANKK